MSSTMASLLLRSTKAQASAAAALVATSTLFVTASKSSPPNSLREENQQDNEGASPKTTPPVLVKQHQSPIASSWSRLLPRDDQVCSCQGFRPPSDTRALKRMQTIRRMDRASTKETLESRYSINPSDPPLGEGAFGVVVRATHRASGEHVALKRIPKEMTDDESFQAEMDALLRVRSSGGHPHICALRENFDEGKEYCLVLDLVSGGEMFDHLCRSGPYSEADAARLVREVASALAFLHGIGVVHADLKPENLMLSTEQTSDAVVKLVDFGCSKVLWHDDDEDNMLGMATTTRSSSPTSSGGGGHTPAYSPPESFRRGQPVKPAADMWALGVILYIMLIGAHPFDLSGRATDEEVAALVKDKKKPLPIRGTPLTEHLSESAKDLMERLMHRDPKKRMTAYEMLEHPWVRGETANTEIIAGSDERLSRLRVYKSRLQRTFFQNVVKWSDDIEDEPHRKRSLVERQFQSFDKKKQGFLTTRDFDDDDSNTDESGGESLSMSDFQNLLSENMKDKYFPRDHVIYREGDIGNHMYFINSGTIIVTTKDGSRAIRKQGDFFGEGALLHPSKRRSATIRCKTPVHALQISREYFEKYLSTSESSLLLTLREKDKIRKRNRAKTILRLQKTLTEREYKKGDPLFSVGEEGDSLFVIERGKVDILVGDKHVLTATPGNLCGEHSLIMGQKRNSTAVCASEDGCSAQQMKGEDFRKLMKTSPDMKASLRDLCLRRDFKKAVVLRLNKEFPYQNPREAYDAVCAGKCGDVGLGVKEVGDLMRQLNPEYSDDEILEIIRTLDLSNSGSVTFDEFKKVFVADIRTSASI